MSLVYCLTARSQSFLQSDEADEVPAGLDELCHLAAPLGAAGREDGDEEAVALGRQKGGIIPQGREGGAARSRVVVDDVELLRHGKEVRDLVVDVGGCAGGTGVPGR